MSAQQRDSRSRGQMSTTTGSPAASAPWPDSCPSADCAPWATITSPGRSQPCSSQRSRHRRPDVLGREPGRSSRIRSAATRHRGVGGLLRAPDAGQLRRRSSPAGAVTNASGSTSSTTPPARRWSATASGNSGGTIARSRPSSRHARSAISSVQLVAADAVGQQLVGAELRGVEHVDPERADLVGVEHADGRHAAAVRLGVQERVDDPRPGSRGTGRATCRGRRRSAGQARGISSRRASTSGTWRV